MTTITISDNIFKSTDVVLDYLRSPAAFDEPSEMGDVRWISLAISGEENEAVFSDFYENFLTALQGSCGIYFFYSESFKEQKSKVRSHVKMFYQLRKAKAIPGEHLIEKEIDLADNESIMTGIMQVDELSIDHAIDELAANGFKFGLVVDNSSVARKPLDMASLKAQLTEELFTIGKSVRVNYLSLIKKLLVPNAFIYSYMYDGKDDLIFTIYAGADVYQPLLEKIEHSLPKGELVTERQATTEEVDRVIDLYFRDWMPARDRE